MSTTMHSIPFISVNIYEHSSTSASIHVHIHPHPYPYPSISVHAHTTHRIQTYTDIHTDMYGNVRTFIHSPSVSATSNAPKPASWKSSCDHVGEEDTCCNLQSIRFQGVLLAVKCTWRQVVHSLSQGISRRSTMWMQAWLEDSFFDRTVAEIRMLPSSS